MKIRSGFVSNSSSSSFCILGVEVDSDTFEKVDAIPYNERTTETLNGETSISYEGQYYVGYDPGKMKEDETLSQFKDRIVDAASKVGITIKKEEISWITDGGYNG